MIVMNVNVRRLFLNKKDVPDLQTLARSRNGFDLAFSMERDSFLNPSTGIPS